jgi:hypothetical protein
MPKVEDPIAVDETMSEFTPYQGEFFIVAEESGQIAETRPPDWDAEGPLAVSVVEHHVLLQNALTKLMTARRLQNIPNPGGAKYKPTANQMRVDAKSLFARATGSAALSREFNRRHIREAGSSLNAMFSDFLKAYYLRGRYAAAKAYRQELADRTAVFLLFGTSQYNREHELRPHKKTQKTPEGPKQLSTFERLQAIKEDPRAGYYPGSNLEKNLVIQFLDYLDNPDYPLQINSQFLEVFNNAQTQRRKPQNRDLDSTRGPVSIVYELGDFLRDAKESIVRLEALKAHLGKIVNRNTTLGEEEDVVPLTHLGLPALIRFTTIKALVKAKDEKGLHSTMRTVVHRWTKTGPGKHKHVGDKYTSDFTSPKVRAAVLDSVRTAPNITARNSIDEVILDQRRRETLMRTLLVLATDPDDNLPSKAKEMLSGSVGTAKQILQELYPDEFTIDSHEDIAVLN